MGVGSSSIGTAAWFLMVFGAIPWSSHQAELHAKFPMKRFRIRAHHFKPAAFGRAFRTKCTDNHVATFLDRMSSLSNVGKASLWRCEKMECLSVLPEIVGMRFQLDFNDFSDQPMHLLRRLPSRFFVTSIAV